MTTKAEQRLSIPGFRYRGFDVPALELSPSLIDDLGTSEPAYKLAPKSVPLAWSVGLYMVGRDLEIGSEEAEALPGPVKEAGRMVYSDCQEKKGRGVWHKDAVIFEPGTTIKGNMIPGEGYIVGRYFQDIEGFEEKDGAWRPKTTPETKEERLWIPLGDGRFIVPTKNGAYNILGIPEETVEDYNKALKMWMDTGLTEEQSRKEMSMFYKESDDGTHAVISWSVGNYGPLCVSLSDMPWGWDQDVGSFAASRSAERSEAPKNSGYMLLTIEELRSFEDDRKVLESVRKAVNK